MDGLIPIRSIGLNTSLHERDNQLGSVMCYDWALSPHDRNNAIKSIVDVLPKYG